MLLLIVCKPLKHICIADIDLISPKFIFICNHGTKIDFAVFIFDFNSPPPPLKWIVETIILSYLVLWIQEARNCLA